MFFRYAASLFLAVCIALSGFGGSLAQANSSIEASVSAIAEKYIRTELYFGLSRKGGQEISDAEFQAFIDEFVTPRFPSGFTVLDARGQWQEDDGKITKERTRVLIVIYRRNERRSANSKVEDVRNEYKKRFSQQSVIRSDITKGITIAF